MDEDSEPSEVLVSVSEPADDAILRAAKRLAVELAEVAREATGEEAWVAIVDDGVDEASATAVLAVDSEEEPKSFKSEDQIPDEPLEVSEEEEVEPLSSRLKNDWILPSKPVPEEVRPAASVVPVVATAAAAAVVGVVAKVAAVATV